MNDTQSDPIPDHILKQLVQARAIFNPPRTMVTPEGYVVDVPPEEVPLPADTGPAAIGDPATAAPAGDAAAASTAGDLRDATATHSPDAAHLPHLQHNVSIKS